MAGVIIGITAMVWNISAERERRTRFPEEGRFYPSRWWVRRSKGFVSTLTYVNRWSKQVIEHERAKKHEQG